MCAEYLNQRNLQGRNFTVEENACQIELNLETDVYIRTIDCWTPPQGEATIGDLVETGSLSVGELLKLHRL